MVQEATMIIVDDSDFMRNGDYDGTRGGSQSDAVKMICQVKQHANRENTLGLLAFSKPDLLHTLTTDVAKVMNKMYGVQPKDSAKLTVWKDVISYRHGGEAKAVVQFVTALRIAHLVLRHRMSKVQKMRIVAFVGSAVWEDDKDLVRLGRRLKKEKVAVDVVSFGDVEANKDKLELFVNAVNSVGKEGGCASHLLNVPPGSKLSEVLSRSEVVVGEDGVAAPMPMSIGANGNVEFEDLSEDPELLMALRVSMEEQRFRQEQERGAAGATGGSLATVPETTMLGGEEGVGGASMLEQAIRMSQDQDGGQMITEVPNPLLLAPNVAPDDDMTNDDMLAIALAMSLAESQETTAADSDNRPVNDLAQMQGTMPTLFQEDDPEVKEKEENEKSEKE